MPANACYCHLGHTNPKDLPGVTWCACMHATACYCHLMCAFACCVHVCYCLLWLAWGHLACTWLLQPPGMRLAATATWHAPGCYSHLACAWLLLPPGVCLPATATWHAPGCYYLWDATFLPATATWSMPACYCHLVPFVRPVLQVAAGGWQLNKKTMN